MIDFIIKDNEDVVNNISADVLTNTLSEKVNIDLVNFMIENQEDIEVTYHKNLDKYRFDFVDITELVLKYIESESDRKFLEGNKFSANIDLDLENNRFVLFHAIDGIGPIVDSDLNESEKLDLIKEFKEFQKELKTLGFKLEPIDDSSMMSLVSENLSDLTSDTLAKAVSKIEKHELEKPILYY